MKSGSDYLNAKDIVIEEVKTDVPGWESVFVCSVDGVVREQLETASRQFFNNKLENFRALVVSKGVCDDAGNLLFTPADVPALGKKNAKVLSILTDRILKLAGITESEKDHLEKN